MIPTAPSHSSTITAFSGSAQVKRGVTARDEYEKIARDIRFNAYKSALEERGEGACPTVMFGHHEGDVEENVLTNLVKGCSILGLAGEIGTLLPSRVTSWVHQHFVYFHAHVGKMSKSVLHDLNVANRMRSLKVLVSSRPFPWYTRFTWQGMLPENTVNGVRVWRPMLPFGKAVVYDFAHKFGVPYFKDTTPSWSTRGKLRRQLVRAITCCDIRIEETDSLFDMEVQGISISERRRLAYVGIIFRTAMR